MGTNAHFENFDFKFDVKIEISSNISQFIKSSDEFSFRAERTE
jgi:hypothetical protein